MDSEQPSSRSSPPAKAVDTFPMLPGPRDDAPSLRPAQPERHGEWTAPADYEIIRQLGRGGMGTVYLARQCSLDRFVALKVLTAGANSGVEARTRFEAEARLAAALRHPNIVQVIEFGEEAGSPFIVLEYVPGQTLSADQAQQPQPAASAARLLSILADAVHSAHAQGVIHRDLKPTNVLITTEGVPKITDFGLAKSVDSSAALTRSGEIMGTPSYMSPEQASGNLRLIGPGTDVYALGAILYELLTGIPPFRGPDPVATLLEVLRRDPVSPRRLVAATPRDLETICLKCLEKSVRGRYATAAELRDDLDRFLQTRPISARRPGPVERAWKWSRRQPALAALAATVVLSASAFMGYAIWKNAQLASSLADNRRALSRSERNYRSALDAAIRRIDTAGQPASHMLMEELQFFESIRNQAGDDRAALHERALAARCSGDVLAKLGRNEDALEAYADAETKLTAIIADDPTQPAYHRDLGAVHNQAGKLRASSGDARGAEAAYQQALAAFEHLARDAQGDLDAIDQQAVIWNNLGLLAAQAINRSLATERYEKAIALRQRLVEADPRHAEYSAALVECEVNLASTLHALGKTSDAAPILRVALDQISHLPSNVRLRSRTRIARASALMTFSSVLAALGETGDAVTAGLDGANEFVALARDNPEIPRYRQSQADAHLNLGKLYLGREELPAALTQFESAVTLLEGLAREYPDVPGYAQQLERMRPGVEQIRQAVAEEQKAGEPAPPASN